MELFCCGPGHSPSSWHAVAWPTASEPCGGGSSSSQARPRRPHHSSATATLSNEVYPRPRSRATARTIATATARESARDHGATNHPTKGSQIDERVRAAGSERAASGAPHLAVQGDCDLVGLGGGVLAVVVVARRGLALAALLQRLLLLLLLRRLPRLLGRLRARAPPQKERCLCQSGAALGLGVAQRRAEQSRARCAVKGGGVRGPAGMLACAALRRSMAARRAASTASSSATRACWPGVMYCERAGARCGRTGEEKQTIARCGQGDVRLHGREEQRRKQARRFRRVGCKETHTPRGRGRCRR